MINYFIDLDNKYASFTCSKCGANSIASCSTFDKLEMEYIAFSINHVECKAD